MEPSTPISMTKIISEKIEPSTLAPEYVSFKVEVLAPNPKSIASEAPILIRESLTSPMTEPTLIILEKSSIPIVEEPFPQENMALEIEVTPAAP